MTPDIHDSLDLSRFSCFPSSSSSSSSSCNMICKKLKWSTISITTALILIIIYASSGLYTLIDVTTHISTKSINDNNETILWPIFSSSTAIILSWTSLTVYFSIVLFVIVLLCGIQFKKPWILFLWSILMIVMLLIDGIITVLSLRQHQQQMYEPTMKVKILFIIMIVRLIISLCGIFIIIFHFRQLNKSQSDYNNRQRMLTRYNTGSTSTSYEDSWARSNELLNPSKDNIDDHRLINDFTTSMSLPRAKVASIQRHQTSTLFQTRNSPLLPPEYHDYPNQSSISEYKDDIRYNIPLEERFYQNKTTNIHEP